MARQPWRMRLRGFVGALALLNLRIHLQRADTL